MLCDTHKLIASKIYGIIESELNVKLDYDSFLNGSIAPDINPLMVIIPHVFKNSHKFLNKNVVWLASRNLKCEKKDMTKFSYKLGIVVHFLSDYFCRAHNEVKFLNFISHHKYETELMNYFNSNIDRYDYRGMFNRIDWRYSIEDIKAFIESKISTYRNSGIAPRIDMEYSIEASATVALKIVSRCIENTFDFIRNAA